MNLIGDVRNGLKWYSVSSMLALAAAALLASAADDAESAALEGRRLYEAGRYMEAIAFFDRSIDARPTAFALGFRGNAHRNAGRPESAVADYNAVLAMEPGNPMALNNRANAFRDLGRIDSSLADLEAAVAAAPFHPLPALNLGWTRYVYGRGDAAAEARAFLERNNWRHPASAYFVVLEALAHRRAGRARAARRALEEADSAVPAPVKAAWPWPVVLYLRGGITGQDLLAAAGTEARRLEARAYLGLALAASGKRTEALDHLRWVVEHGNPSLLEYDVARAEVRRLEARRR